MEWCQTSERVATGVAAGMMGATGGASVTALVVGGAVGGAVRGAGNKAVVEGSKNKQEILAAAKHGAKIGAIAGAVGGFGGAPHADTGTAVGQLNRGALDAVVTEVSAVIDTAVEIFSAEPPAASAQAERGHEKLRRDDSVLEARQ